MTGASENDQHNLQQQEPTWKTEIFMQQIYDVVCL